MLEESDAHAKGGPKAPPLLSSSIVFRPAKRGRELDMTSLFDDAPDAP